MRKYDLTADGYSRQLAALAREMDTKVFSVRNSCVIKEGYVPDVMQCALMVWPSLMVHLPLDRDVDEEVALRLAMGTEVIFMPPCLPCIWGFTNEIKPGRIQVIK